MSDFCNQQSTSAPFGHKARQLTVEEIVKLTEDKELVSAFRQQKLEKDAKKNWDLFYKRNLDKFFKDRHWTIREFEELLGIDLMQDGERRNLLEAGCGVGNFLWPLIKSGLPFNYYACDFSPVAVDLVRKHELYRECNCKAFVADLTEPNGIKCRVKDDIRFHLVSLIFVLSAIHPEKMVTALESIHQVSFHLSLLLGAPMLVLFRCSLWMEFYCFVIMASTTTHSFASRLDKNWPKTFTFDKMELEPTTFHSVIHFATLFTLTAI